MTRGTANTKGPDNVSGPFFWLSYVFFYASV